MVLSIFFVTDFIEHKFEWIKDRRTSKTENSEVPIQLLLEGILVPWLANSGLLVVAGKNKVSGDPISEKHPLQII